MYKILSILFIVFVLILGIELIILLTSKKSPATPSHKNQIKFSSCVILDEKYCKTGKLVYSNGNFYGLGFNLPTGSKVYSLFDGLMLPSNSFLVNGKSYSGVSSYQNVGPKKTDVIGFVLIVGSKSYLKTNSSERYPAKKGDVIAQIGNVESNLQNKYSVIISIRKYNPLTKYQEPNLELTKTYFK